MVRLFGIRHHGPGSAHSLLQALTTMQPDLLLVEGPPEANDLLSLLAHSEMEPPVALLIYATEQPQRAAFYPFARFSPEYQALLYAVRQGIPARLIDLPLAHQLAEEPATTHVAERPESDPFTLLAQAAGYSDGERWWEHFIEQRQPSSDLFDAILEVMTHLRAEPEDDTVATQQLVQREAWMRQNLRQAQREGFTRIAVVCGAWHAPALATLPPAKADATLLKGLPKIAVSVTWTPWSYGRLTAASGYGAGVHSPGWYDHLWRHRQDEAGQPVPERLIIIRWLTQVAHLLREQALDASAASVIETVRLAETLAAMRNRRLPDLADLNEAVRAILCGGDELPMRLIQQRLIVGEQLGRVPPTTPLTPFQQSLQQEQRRLRLPPAALTQTLELDLRKPLDLERSVLLHRLNLLNIPWGQVKQRRSKGTFREGWQLTWQPEFALRSIEASLWGNTVLAAAGQCVMARATGKTVMGATASTPVELTDLTHLLDGALLADLPDAVAALMTALQNHAALSGDVIHLIDALPPLVNVARYGNVRQTDVDAVLAMVDGFVARICVGLPTACSALNDDAARALLPRLLQTHNALQLLAETTWRAQWFATLQQLADQRGLHGLLAGLCCRLLLDEGKLAPDECARRLGLALATANDPAQAAAWVEGLLQGSGLLLLHDARLLLVIDSWVSSIDNTTFTQVLPLLRRTFATFSQAERRQIGDRIRHGDEPPSGSIQLHDGDFDPVPAAQVLPMLARLLGLTLTEDQI